MYLQERMYSKCSTLTIAEISDILPKNYDAFFYSVYKKENMIQYAMKIHSVEIVTTKVWV